MKNKEIEIIFQNLKAIMKDKKVSYKDLAKKLDLAESTIKRIFSHKNCSLDKLFEICDAIDISFSELSELVKKNTKLPTVKLSKEVEEFFLHNHDYFKFYRQFSLYNDLEIVKKKNDLNDKSVKKYSDKLIELGLLKKIESEKIVISDIGFVQFSEMAKLKSYVFDDWSKHLLNNALNQEKKFFFKASSTRLTKKSIDYFQNEFNSLLKRFAEQGYIENFTSKKDVEPIGFYFVSGPEIVNFTGKIKNLIN